MPSANANAEGSNAGSSSSVNGSSSSSSAPTRIKREIIDEEEHDENLAYEARARNGHDGHDDDDDAEDLDIIPGDPYFKRRRVAH